MKLGVSTKRASVVGVALVGVLLAIGFLQGSNATSTDIRGKDHPALFDESSRCPSTKTALRNGIVAEETARLRADRYPYDPRDGVRAVHGYRTASSCYDAAGRPSDAERARFAGQELADRIVTDYAAARLSLANAIQAERWAEVLRRTRHLQLLTSHLGGHEYVEWLKELVGKATARHYDPS